MEVLFFSSTQAMSAGNLGSVVLDIVRSTPFLMTLKSNNMLFRVRSEHMTIEISVYVLLSVRIHEIHDGIFLDLSVVRVPVD